MTPKALQGAALAVFGCPTRLFTPKEIAALHAFVDQVGSAIHLLQRACRHCVRCECTPRQQPTAHHAVSNALSVASTVPSAVIYMLKHLTPLLDAAAFGSQAGQNDICMTRLQGGSLVVFACAADSSEADVSANLNTLLGRYGIAVNRDALFSIVQQVLWLRVQRLLIEAAPCSRHGGTASQQPKSIMADA